MTEVPGPGNRWKQAQAELIQFIKRNTIYTSVTL